MNKSNIESVGELKIYFSCSTKMADHLTSLLSFFEFKRVYNLLNSFKKRGYHIADIFSMLVILPFLKHASVHPLFKSLSKDFLNVKKDVYYRFKKSGSYSMTQLAIKFCKAIHIYFWKKGAAEIQGKRCLIIDDSLLEKTGKAIEFAGKL